MSNFIVSARKYRPARFDEVVGQQHVSQTLKNALQNDHLAHAFLFCGPRGVGKTTCARILAKVLNCTNLGKDYEACDTCNSCTAFNENASFNIVELDAASNNSVEHIRALIEQVRFQPQQGKYKVFIIDEVHMLSQAAFNAFLKTLEEPPPYAIFILATTEKHKIIPTILSRCQIFDFRRIMVPDMVGHLQEICEKEKITADKDALHIIGQKADGALRDALSIFDRIVSFSGQKIIYDDVISNLNILDYDFFFQLVDSMLVEDLATVLTVFNDILKKGFEPDIFINGFAGHLRDLLVCNDEKTVALLEVSDNLKNRYKEQAKIAPTAFLLTALNIANECDVNYKMARNKRLHVEMAIIKMTYINRAVALQRQTNATSSGVLTPTTEKKTPELSNNVSIPAAPIKLEPKTTIDSPPLAQTPVIEKKPIQKSNTIKATSDPTTNTASTQSLGTESKHLTTRIPSLDMLEKEVEHQSNEEEKNEKVLTQEDVNEAWTAYTRTVTSPSVRNTLKKADVILGEEKIIVTIGTRIAKEMLQQEKELMPFLRTQLKQSKMAMELNIDASKAPSIDVSKPKTVLTTKEKFDKMKKVNPLVDEMLKRFNLKPDND